MFKAANFDGMAKHFALCEFVITKGLTNSFVSELPTLQNLSYENSPVCTTLSVVVNGVTSANVGGNTVFNISSGSVQTGVKGFATDSHSTGALVALMQYSVLYLGYSTLLLELIDQLKAAPYNPADPNDKRTMFDETIIETASEFERIPDMTGAGSQHGPNANTFSCISGSVPKLSVVGNIRQGLKYPGGGTWGIGEKVRGVGGAGIAEIIRATHVCNTICTMLKIKPITTAEVPIAYVDADGKIQVNRDLEPPTNKVDP